MSAVLQEGATKCLRCGCKTATAHALTRRDAERLRDSLAVELLRERPALDLARAQELAMHSILTKRPSLLICCDGCQHEVVE